MARQLAYTVHVPVYTEADGVRSLDRTEMFLQGTELPEWAVPFVGRHVYEEGEAPEDAPVNPAPAVNVDQAPAEQPAAAPKRARRS